MSGVFSVVVFDTMVSSLLKVMEELVILVIHVGLELSALMVVTVVNIVLTMCGVIIIRIIAIWINFMVAIKHIISDEFFSGVTINIVGLSVTISVMRIFFYRPLLVVIFIEVLTRYITTRDSFSVIAITTVQLMLNFVVPLVFLEVIVVGVVYWILVLTAILSKFVLTVLFMHWQDMIEFILSFTLENGVLRAKYFVDSFDVRRFMVSYFPVRGN